MNGKNNTPKTTTRKNLTKKEMNIIKYILTVLSIIILFNVGYYLVYANTDMSSNAYIKHCLFPIVILIVGIIALILPFANKYSSYTAATKNDKYMYLAGVVLMFGALIMFIGSFM